MKFFKCPKCNYQTIGEDNRYAVICPCGTYCDELPAPEDGVIPKKAPTILFKGTGWTEKGDGNKPTSD